MRKLFAIGWKDAIIRFSTIWELVFFIVLPLILATVVATAASKALGAESVYETELGKRGLGWEMTLEGRQLKSPPIE